MTAVSALEKVAILIADDHQLIREALRPYLLKLGHEVVIYEAESYSQVLALDNDNSKSNIPDLIMLDLSMPDQDQSDRLNGLRQICQKYPESAVVVFSAITDKSTISSALKSGAKGYITKGTTGTTLISALRLVLEGEIYIPPALIAENLSTSDNDVHSSPLVPNKDNLTEREISVLRLLCQGLSNKAIGQKLQLQEVTIKMHLRNTCRKIGATNRTEAVRIAVQKSLV